LTRRLGAGAGRIIETLTPTEIYSGKTTMKYVVPALIAALILTTAPAPASPLQKEQVAADAKWLLHVDLEQFRASKIGSYFAKEILEAKLTKPKEDLKRELNFDLDVNKISSITAYGTDYQRNPDANGVLVIKTDLDVTKALDGLIEKFTKEAGEGAGPVKREKRGSATTYSFHNEEGFVSVHPGKLVVLGKSREAVEKAEAVLSGKSANLSTGKAFSGFPETPKAFFFLAIAEGFNEDAPLPPQAKVLKMTEGARLILGENAANLFLNLALKAKSSEVMTQMQQVIQGTVALASLSQQENPDLMQLAQSVKVSGDDKMVTVGVEFPVEKAIRLLGEKKAKSRDDESGASKKKDN
jgi:hypothetical protein